MSGMFFNVSKDKLVKVEVMNNFHPFPDSLKDGIRLQEDSELIRIVRSFEYRSWWDRWFDYFGELIFFDLNPTLYSDIS